MSEGLGETAKMKTVAFHPTPVEIQEKSMKMASHLYGWDLAGGRACLLLLRVQQQQEGFRLKSRTGLPSLGWGRQRLLASPFPLE